MGWLRHHGHAEPNVCINQSCKVDKQRSGYSLQEETGIYSLRLRPNANNTTHVTPGRGPQWPTIYAFSPSCWSLLSWSGPRAVIIDKDRRIWVKSVIWRRVEQLWVEIDGLTDWENEINVRPCYRRPAEHDVVGLITWTSTTTTETHINTGSQPHLLFYHNHHHRY